MALIIPVVIVKDCPKGLPIAIASSPGDTILESPKFNLGKFSFILITARSEYGSIPINSASNSSLLYVRTIIL